MPRKKNPANEINRAAQEAYRERLEGRKCPETDAVDTAVSVAVSVFAFIAANEGNNRDRLRSQALERMAINYLVSRGFAYDEVKAVVGRRLGRLDVHELIPLVDENRIATHH